MERLNALYLMNKTKEGMKICYDVMKRMMISFSDQLKEKKEINLIISKGNSEWIFVVISSDAFLV